MRNFELNLVIHSGSKVVRTSVKVATFVNKQIARYLCVSVSHLGQVCQNATSKK